MGEAAIELIELARALEVGNDEPDLFLEKLQDYTDRMDNWLRAGMAEQGDATEVQTLLDLHNTLLARAEVMLGGASDEFRQLKTKRKAIIAYTDTLPKRISTQKRKG